MSPPLLYFETARDAPAWIVALVFFIPFGGGLILYFYKTRHARSWRKGIYPPKLKLTEDNLLEAYLALGSLLILIDYGKSKDKTQFINQYFNRYFTRANYNFGDSLLFSIQHPIKIDSVCDWLNNNLEGEGARAQVIYFLTGLAMLDGTISRKELQFLEIMTRKLNLSVEHLERVISIYRNYHKSKQTQSQQRENQQRAHAGRNSKKKLYADILHLGDSPTQEELKQTYRKLVKLHHPDRFAQAPEAQQLLAKEKFQQIQEAYEFWQEELK